MSPTVGAVGCVLFWRPPKSVERKKRNWHGNTRSFVFVSSFVVVFVSVKPSPPSGRPIDVTYLASVTCLATFGNFFAIDTNDRNLRILAPSIPNATGYAKRAFLKVFPLSKAYSGEDMRFQRLPPFCNSC